MKEGDHSQIPFNFLKKLKMRQKQVVCSLVSLYFESLLLRDILNFSFLEKGPELVSPPHFVYDFQKNVFHVTFY